MSDKPFILICGPLGTRSGYGDHCRDLFHSFYDLNKYEIQIVDVPWGNTPRNALNKKLDNDIIQSILLEPKLDKKPDVYVDIRIPNEFQTYGEFNIGITAGIETTAVSNNWIENCNKMDLVIVPSEHSARGFAVQYDKIDDRTQQKVDTLELKKPLEILFEGIDEKIYIKNPNKIDDNINECLNSIKEDF